MPKRYKGHRDYGFFDQNIRLSKLSDLGDPLKRLLRGVDFEFFLDLLESRLSKSSKGKAGRPAYDYVLMFKIFMPQRYYNFSVDQAEYQSNDRMSFMRFLNLTISGDITDLESVAELFDLFGVELNRLNLIVNEGKIIDASFVEVPKQRNDKEKKPCKNRWEKQNYRLLYDY